MNMILELQKAVFTRLNTDATLSAMVTGVFDFVPQGTEYPYATIGTIAAKDWSTATTVGLEAKVEIEVFSRGRGRKETLDIIQCIRVLLHQASLTVTGHTLVDIFFTESEVAQQRDGLTYRGTITFKARVQE